MNFKVGQLVIFNREEVEDAFITEPEKWVRLNETDFLVESEDKSRYDKFKFGSIYKVTYVDYSEEIIKIEEDPSGDEWDAWLFRPATAKEVARWKLKNET